MMTVRRFRIAATFGQALHGFPFAGLACVGVGVPARRELGQMEIAKVESWWVTISITLRMEPDADTRHRSATLAM